MSTANFQNLLNRAGFWWLHWYLTRRFLPGRLNFTEIFRFGGHTCIRAMSSCWSVLDQMGCLRLSGAQAHAHQAAVRHLKGLQGKPHVILALTEGKVWDMPCSRHAVIIYSCNKQIHLNKSELDQKLDIGGGGDNYFSTDESLSCLLKVTEKKISLIIW